MDFQFYIDYILENDKVLLRPLEEKHFDDLLEYSLNEPELWQFSLGGAAGAENLKSYIKMALKSREDEIAYPFVVIDKLTNKAVGTTRFYEVFLSQKSLSIGHTWYGKLFHGTGLNKNCKYLLFEFAFEKMGIERVEFRADARNSRSIAAMKSIGCVFEGTLRSNGIASDGNRRDSVVLSVLKDEWQNKVKAELSKKL